MSLSPTEHWHLSLHPDGWAFGRVRLGKLRHPIAEKTCPDVSDWQGVIRDFDAWLGAQPRMGKRVDIVLSNHFMRFAVVPWQAEIRKPADLEAVARVALEAVISADQEAWSICLSNMQYGVSSLACALPKAILERLALTLEAHGAKLGSVQPLLAKAATLHSGRESKFGVHVCMEGAAVWACAVTAAGFRWFRQLAADEESMLAAIKRQHILAGVDADLPIFLTSVGLGADNSGAAAMRRILARGSVPAAMLKAIYREA